MHLGERTRADASVTVGMLQADVESWLEFCDSRDILALFHHVRRKEYHKHAPSTCLGGIVSIKTLLYIMLQRVPNSVVPRSKFIQALINVHQKASIYVGERSIANVADEISGYVRVALAKVRVGPVV